MIYNVVSFFALFTVAAVSGQFCAPSPCCNQVYSVPLSSCGPCSPSLPPVLTRQVAPTVCKPTVTLPGPCIPPPQTLSHVCNCQKTIVKPQVFHKTITVPSVQKFVQTGYSPVVDTITYKAIPSNCDSVIPISSPIGLPLSGGCGLPGPLDFSFGASAPCGLPLPAPYGLPLSAPCGLPIPSPCGLPLGIPSPCGLPLGIPAPCGLPLPSPCGLPLGIPSPCGLPLGIPSPCGLPLPSPCGLPLGIPAPCGLPLPSSCGFPIPSCGC